MGALVFANLEGCQDTLRQSSFSFSKQETCLILQADEMPLPSRAPIPLPEVSSILL